MITVGSKVRLIDRFKDVWPGEYIVEEVYPEYVVLSGVVEPTFYPGNLVEVE